MTMQKIAVTLPREYVEEARRAVAAGRAGSVSAYIAQSVAAQQEKDGLRMYLDELVAEYGAPTDDDYAWADEQIARSDEFHST